jgi:hypothetical protein
MTDEPTARVELTRNDMMRILYALGYTKTGMKIDDRDADDFVAPEKLGRIANEINKTWHEEYHD